MTLAQRVILHAGRPRAQASAVFLSEDSMPWHLAILGAGSAAAYYLNTVDRSLYPKIVVIGGDDPWAGQRGGNPGNPSDPANIVNQNESMIGHFGSSAPQTSDRLVPRSEWAKENARIIDKCKVDRINGEVLKVKKVSTSYLDDRDRAAMNGAVECYAIEVRRKNFSVTYYAPKVVVATGAGAHKAPDKRFPALAQRYPDLFMDMDAFGRRPELRSRGKTIIVQGPNAAVDSVDTAAFNGCKVHWLSGTPAILATPHQVGARAVRDGVDKANIGQIYALNRQSEDPETIQVTGNKIKIKLRSGVELEADHYVWGIGQDSTGAVKFMDPGLLASLEPMYDANQRFGPAYKSVIGFQLTGTTAEKGLQVVGAMTRQVMLARKEMNLEIDHTYLRDMATVIEGIKTKFSYWNQDLTDYGWDFMLAPLEELGKLDAKRLVRAIDFGKTIIARHAPTWDKYFQALGAMIINWVTAKQYLEQNGGKVNDADLNNIVSILTPSTVGSPQLGAIRTAASAMNAFVPEYISNKPGGDANFSHDDRTVLRLFVAVNYPCVPEEDCQRIITRIISGRRSQDKRDPNKEVTPGNWGYTTSQIEQFRKELQVLNDRWAGVFTTAKPIGTGKTVL
jgi:hypothetical protein